MIPAPEERRYVDDVLGAYLDLPDTPTRARSADRSLARSLFAQRVPIDIVRAALVLAAARRACRPHRAPPLHPVNSLHYFLPVIEELRREPPDPSYIAYVTRKLAQAVPDHR